MTEINWPSNYKFGAWFSHDVDRVDKTYQYIYKFLKERRFYHIKSFFSNQNPYWTFDELMNIEKENEIRSTLFFLNESIKLKILTPSTYKLALGRYDINEKRIVDIIKKFDYGGWEIGIHGSYNSYNNLEILRNEKIIIEKIIDKDIYGIRQHYLNLNIPKTWEFQKKIGLKYDGSFGNKKLGFRENRIHPFRPFKDDFLVFPLNIWDGPMFKGEWNKERLLKECTKIIDIVKKNNSVVSVLYHSDRFNNKEYPGQIDVYEEIINYIKEQEGFIGTGYQIYNHIIGN